MTDLQVIVSKALSFWTRTKVPVEWRHDRKGVMTGWCRLQEPESIMQAAQAVACLEGRLSMVTAYLTKAAKLNSVRQLAYHFDLDGTTLTVTVELPLAGARIPSITPIFRNADWNEREFMELYDVQVAGHPDPRRLFLDDTIEPAAFERLIPYSTFSNGANGKALWDKVMAGSSGETGPLAVKSGISGETAPQTLELGKTCKESP